MKQNKKGGEIDQRRGSLVGEEIGTYVDWQVQVLVLEQHASLTGMAMT